MHRPSITAASSRPLRIAAAYSTLPSECANKRETPNPFLGSSTPTLSFCHLLVPSSCYGPAAPIPASRPKGTEVRNRPCCVPRRSRSACFIPPSGSCPCQPFCPAAAPAHGTVSFTVASPLHTLGERGCSTSWSTQRPGRTASSAIEGTARPAEGAAGVAGAEGVKWRRADAVATGALGRLTTAGHHLPVTLVYYEKTKETKRVVTGR